MPKFDVNVYAVVRIKVAGIEAATHEEALKLAEEPLDYDGLFNQNNHPDPHIEHIESACEINGFLVDGLDEEGDLNEANTFWFDMHGERQLPYRCRSCDHITVEPLKATKKEERYCPICMGGMGLLNK